MIEQEAAMRHLRNVLYMLANLAPGDRCKAFEAALAFYNEHNPNARVEPEEGFETRLEHYA